MSEWLTTGQMIDQLQVGERVEAEDGSIAEKLADGEIRWVDNGCVTVRMSAQNINSRWRILPQYVSFEEAIKARKEGKGIKLHRKNETTYISSGSSMKLKDGWLAHLTLDDLIKGDWTIEN
ncbi:hypothetical protein K7T73_12670 [Bacillus badius]|uniref:hypothetical protein n=1 Tax=Bacillus badius TaxID=1455 RepID=UPI001CBC9602|nr:hypothetical protein [Bacillus badius]UAT29453.1 hypothetical protein K7T73_12670 [Bacillus badius]